MNPPESLAGDPSAKRSLAQRTIDSLTNSGLEGAAFPLPDLESMLSGAISWVRITRMSRFWKNQESTSVAGLVQAVADLLAGLHGQNRGWVYVLHHSGSEIACWLGVRDADEREVKSLLHGAYPGVTLSECLWNGESLRGFTHAVGLAGVPSGKMERGDQIEKLCRTLPRTPWAYVVSAQVVSAAATLVAISESEREISELRGKYFASGEAIQKMDAERAASLHESQMARLEQGRLLGRWRASVYLFADGAAITGQGGSVLRGAFSGAQSLPQPIRVHACRVGAQGSPEGMFTSLEAALLARPPCEELPGYDVIDSVRFGVAVDDPGQTGAPTIELGSMIDAAGPNGGRLDFPLKELTKHALIAGVTGSGKTNTCLSLLTQVWSRHKVPFLVIEPAKSEYRRLLAHEGLAGSLRVFTIGNETVSPLRLNPLEALPGTLIQTHIDYLKSLFSAAFVLYPPMPYVLETSLYQVYEDRGWNLVLNTNSRGEDHPRRFPTLSDLIIKVRQVVDRMQYSGDVLLDVKAGLVARLENLCGGGGKGPMFNTRRSVPARVLFEEPCLLELEAVVSDEEKAFIIGMILILLQEHRRGSQPVNELIHLTLIEEAHRLLRNVPTEQGSEVSANPQGKAIEVFANILAEIRASGEGILIAEQIPAKLIPDALKNTNLKIIHRLVAADDRESLGSAMSLDPAQKNHLARLTAGEAVLYAESFRKPVLAQITRADVHEAFVAESVVRASTQSLRDDAELFVPADPARSRNHRTEAQLTRAFDQLFNAMRVDPLATTIVEEAWVNFTVIMRRERTTDPDAAARRAASLLGAQVEARGEFWGWTHGFVDAVAELGTDILFRLGREEEYGENLATFAEVLSEVHDAEISEMPGAAERPFPACAACQRPCHYRFDAARAIERLTGEELEALAASISEADTVKTLRYTMREAFLDADRATLEGATLCCAAHVLAEYSPDQLGAPDQEETAWQIAAWLAEDPDASAPADEA